MSILAARQALTRAGTSRAGRCIGFAALALLLGNKSLQNAVAEGDTRTISLHHIHTGEDLTVTFKRDGRYDQEALKKINHLLRDWRRNEETRMDPRLLDVVWEVYRDVDAKGPIQVVCGYRSPATNAMLRRRSRGVAQYSQHMLGRAMDFFIPGVPLEAQREAGLRLQRGGVGYYPTSGSPFVHLDVGNVRHWPRMTREQLAHVFPNGRTVHIPSDGRPLSGYALALADIQKRGSSVPSQMSLDAAGSAGVNAAAAQRPARKLFAALFGSKDEDEDSETAAEPNPAPAARVNPNKAAEAKSATPKAAEAKRVAAARLALRGTTRPGETFSLASAESEPARLTGAATAGDDVIASRGLWDAPAAASQTKAPEQPAVAAAQAPRPRSEPRPSASDTTGAVGPWPIELATAADRVPPELALAYAAQANVTAAAPPVTRSLAPSNVIPRNATTLQPTRVADAIKRTVSTPQPAPVTAAAPERGPGTSPNDPWLRALVLAPDLQNYMTATLLGQADMRELVPLMEKPEAVVTMTFGDDPQLGIASDHFSGSAVVFVPTQSFAKRTVALQ